MESMSDNGYFNITSSSGVNASKDGNEVNATLDDICHKEKRSFCALHYFNKVSFSLRGTMSAS